MSESFGTLYVDSHGEILPSGGTIIWQKKEEKVKKKEPVRPWENEVLPLATKILSWAFPIIKAKKCSYCSFNYSEADLIDWYGEYVCHACAQEQCKEMGTTVDDEDVEDIDVVVDNVEHAVLLEDKIVSICDEVTAKQISIVSTSYDELLGKVCAEFCVQPEDVFFLMGTKPLTFMTYDLLNSGDNVILKSVLCGGYRRRAKKGKKTGRSPKKRLGGKGKSNKRGKRLGPGEENKGTGRITKLLNVRTLPDEFKEDYAYNEGQRNIFNAAVVSAAVYWRMNSMFTIQDGGSGAIIPDWSNGGMVGMAGNYRRYRVLKSTIEIRIRNRETVNPIEVMLFTSESNAAITTAALFTWRAAQPYVQRKQLGPAGASDAKATMRMSFCPSKFVGQQYHEQDQYSAALTGFASPATDPATLFYWGLAFYNVNTNTVTTGGAIITMTIYNRVLVYEVDRDANSASIMDMKVVDGALVSVKKCTDLSDADDGERSDSSQGRRRVK